MSQSRKRLVLKVFGLILMVLIIHAGAIFALYMILKPENPPLNSEWEKLVGGSEGEYGYSVWANETDIYTVGITFSHGGWSQTYINKWDSNGNLIWTRVWGGAQDDRLYSIVVDGHYIYACGTTESHTTVGNLDALLMKYDTNGDLKWYESWGTTAEDRAYSLKLNDSEIFVTGKANNDFLFSKYDASGSQLWDYRFDSSNVDIGRDIWIDGSDIFIHGTTEGYGAGDSDLLLTRWNSTGKLIWNTTWGGSSDESASINGLWSDGSYLFTTGGTKSFGAGDSDIVLIKWSKNGDEIWNFTYGGVEFDVGSSVTGDEAGIYLGGSYTQSGDRDVILFSCSESGIILSNSTCGGPDVDVFSDIGKVGTTLYLTGWTYNEASGDRGQPDIFLLKWDLQ